MQYIDKDTLAAEIERLKSAAETMITGKTDLSYWMGQKCLCERFLSFINTLEVKDLYEQCIQYDSIKAGIQAHAETYSFNIESKLFNQLTKEQQELWRKEIEQACISGGEAGVELTKDPRYKENHDKEVDLDKEISKLLDNGMALQLDWKRCNVEFKPDGLRKLAKHFFKLGLKVQKRE